jgi:hypothetical protein
VHADYSQIFRWTVTSTFEAAAAQASLVSFVRRAGDLVNPA